MATMVASRFAVLSLDDDDDFPKKNQKRKADAKKNAALNQKTDTSQKKKIKKPDPGKTNSSNPNQKAKNKPAAKGDAGNQPKKKPITQEQWDQWKKKDSEFVDGNYEEDLHQAILLSKLDYEKNQDYYDKLRKTAEEAKKLAASAAKKVKKSNKTQTMSLEQFNCIYVDGATAHRNGDVEVPPVEEKVNEEDPEFFERIKDDAQKALTREQSIEQRKAREPFIQEAISRAQFEDTLEKRNKEINALKEEVVKLKEQLHNVKTRNKKLCNILAQGEMRDKAEVLVQVDRLQQVKDELSSEVSTLHAQLEQERSKVRALSSEPRNKSQLYLKKKSVRFDMTTTVAQT